MLERLDFWLAVITLGLLAYFELGKYLAPIIRPIGRMVAGVAEQRREEAEQRRTKLRPSPIRRRDGRFNGSAPAETDRNEGETDFGAVSATATPTDEAETIAFRFLARLIHAGHVTETQALESACGVKAGSSKAYQEARAKLKQALEETADRAVAA